MALSLRVRQAYGRDDPGPDARSHDQLRHVPAAASMALVGSMRGRPGELDDLNAKRIVEAVRRGNSRATAAALGGIATSTLTNWLARGATGEEPYVSFLARVRAADAEVTDRMVSRVIEAADSGNWVAAKTWLELRKGAWRAKKPKEAPQQDLSGKSDEELLAAMEAWIAERKGRKVG